jgi:hypothetical protein
VAGKEKLSLKAGSSRFLMGRPEELSISANL